MIQYKNGLMSLTSSDEKIFKYETHFFFGSDATLTRTAQTNTDICF
jgi:hypothetical protein